MTILLYSTIVVHTYGHISNFIMHVRISNTIMLLDLVNRTRHRITCDTNRRKDQGNAMLAVTIASPLVTIISMPRMLMQTQTSFRKDQGNTQTLSRNTSLEVTIAFPLVTIISIR